MKIRPVETELLHADRRVDGWTDITKLIVAFRNFANGTTKTGDVYVKRNSEARSCNQCCSEKKYYVLWVCVCGLRYQARKVHAPYFTVRSTGHSCTFRAMLYVQVKPSYVGRRKELCTFCVILYTGRNLIPLTGLPVSHSISILSSQVWTIHWNFPMTPHYRGADNSLDRPGMKEVRKHVRDARDCNNIETRAIIKCPPPPPCKARRRRIFTPFWQKHWLVSFLVGLRTYQYSCTILTSPYPFTRQCGSFAIGPPVCAL